MDEKLEAFPSRILTEMSQVKGKSIHLRIVHHLYQINPPRILEYLARDDAENAVKILDGKDLRGQPVRVALAEENSVCIE